MFDFSLPIIFSTFALIFLVELPDKTALATIALASKFKAKHVIIGVWLAFLIQTIVGVLFGRVLLLLPAEPVHIAAGLGFIIFSIFTLHSNESKELEDEKALVKKEINKHHKGWITSFLVIFVSEWGDLSQLTTAALVARTGHPIAVGVGSVLALWTISLLAVLMGAKINRFLSPKKLQKISGYLFLLVGIIMILVTLFPIKL
jgi:putative Ca2+/H+ antiporter (TMEM165/GDT1 family)